LMAGNVMGFAALYPSYGLLAAFAV
jgi:hypothetical protein